MSAGWPGPSGWPIVGDLAAFGRDPLGYCEGLAARWGDVAHFKVVDHDLWLLSHPDDIEQVLVRDARSMHKDQIYELLVPALGRGLVTAEDDLWKRHRKLLAPLFTPKRVDAWATVMVRCAREAALRFPATLDAHREMMALTQRIVLETLFGADLDVDTTAVGHALDGVMEGFVSEAQGIHRVLPGWLPTPLRRRTSRAVAALDETVYALIRARRGATQGDDLLSLLLAASDEAGGLSDREVRDEAVTSFVAGHETTALALTWTFVLLAENPAAWGPLMAEVSQVLGARDATAADHPHLPYTTGVIKESMRLLPPVWGFGRQAQADVTVRGQLVPAGHNLLVVPWVTQRDPRWFPEPLVFRPERWLDAAFVAGLPRMAWFPFGGGPRVCIGQHFAMMEAVLCLATIAQRGRLEPTGPRPALLPSITLRPVGDVPASWVAA